VVTLVVTPPVGSSPVVLEVLVVGSTPVVVSPVVPAVAMVPLPWPASSSIPALSMMPTHALARNIEPVKRRNFFIVRRSLTSNRASTVAVALRAY
jgi:hypothetical protein